MLAGSGSVDDQLARRDPGPVGEANAPLPIELVVEHGEALLCFRGSTHGAKGIIPAGAWQSEYGHDRVADDLLDDAAVRLEDDPHLVEIAGQDLPERLRVKALAEAGRALEVGGDDGDGAGSRVRFGGRVGRCGHGSLDRRRAPSLGRR